jgi:hypothetical protein
LLVGFNQADGSSTAISDSKSNSWTGLTALNAGGEARIFYVESPTVGTGHTVSCAQSYAYVAMSAWSGGTTTSFDQENGATSASATSLASGSITPSEDNELLISCIGLGGTATGLTADTGIGFTALVTRNAVSGVNYGGGVSYQIQTTATARNPSWSWTLSTDARHPIASFKAAAVAGRTTKNTRAFPLGERAGMGFGMAG